MNWQTTTGLAHFCRVRQTGHGKKYNSEVIFAEPLPWDERHSTKFLDRTRKTAFKNRKKLFCPGNHTKSRYYFAPLCGCRDSNSWSLASRVASSTTPPLHQLCDSVLILYIFRTATQLPWFELVTSCFVRSLLYHSTPPSPASRFRFDSLHIILTRDYIVCLRP